MHSTSQHGAVTGRSIGLDIPHRVIYLTLVGAGLAVFWSVGGDGSKTWKVRIFPQHKLQVARRAKRAYFAFSAMNLSMDADIYAKQQEILVGEMIARVADHLEAAGIKIESLKKITGTVVFEIACMLDKVSDLEFESERAFPYLTFQSGRNDLVHLAGNSYTHELVFGILNAMFSGDTQTPSGQSAPSFNLID